jgi:hypothetical protein
MAETFADRKYDKRIPYKPSPESKEMAEKYVAPAILTGMSLLPIGGFASRAAQAKKIVDTGKKLNAKRTSGTFGDRMKSATEPAKAPTKMQPRRGPDGKPIKPRQSAAPAKREGSGTLTDRMGTVKKPADKPTPQPPRRGTDGKVIKREAPKTRGLSTGQKAATGAAASAGIVAGYYGAKQIAARRAAAKDTNAKAVQFEKAYQEVNRKHGTQRPVTETGSAAPKPKAKPANLAKAKRKPEKKSKIRIAFEKEFAAARKKGKKEFAFKGGKYKSYNTRLAK